MGCAIFSGKWLGKPLPPNAGKINYTRIWG